MERIFAIVAALAAGLAVGVGAFGAHGLQSSDLLPEDDRARLLEIFETGVRYHMFHALGLFAVAWAAGRWPGRLVTLAGWLLVVGILIFSGSLYLLVLTQQNWLGAITPIGGTAFIAGWVLLAVATGRQRSVIGEQGTGEMTND